MPHSPMQAARLADRSQPTRAHQDAVLPPESHRNLRDERKRVSQGAQETNRRLYYCGQYRTCTAGAGEQQTEGGSAGLHYLQGIVKIVSTCGSADRLNAQTEGGAGCSANGSATMRLPGIAAPACERTRRRHGTARRHQQTGTGTV